MLDHPRRPACDDLQVRRPGARPALVGPACATTNAASLLAQLQGARPGPVGPALRRARPRLRAAVVGRDPAGAGRSGGLAGQPALPAARRGGAAPRRGGGAGRGRRPGHAARLRSSQGHVSRSARSRNKSLFQIHAEKVLATAPPLRRRRAVPGHDQPGTDAPTREFFAAKRYFGLPKEEVYFFRQGTMPALDLATGKLLMEAPGRLFLSPDGHGGTLTALASSGLLARLREKGIRHIFYFQVDNPLVKVADPMFLGCHIDTAFGGVVARHPQARADRQARQLRADRRPLLHDRVFGPALGDGASRRTRTAGCVCGRAARPSTISTWIS